MDEKFVVKDSGERTDFGTGAVRDMQVGKGSPFLIPPHALLRVARHYENGAKKYGPRNWEMGIPTHSFYDSGFRHLLMFAAGAQDEDHLAAAIWNLMCLCETKYRIKLGLLPADLETLNMPDVLNAGMTSSENYIAAIQNLRKIMEGKNKK